MLGHDFTAELAAAVINAAIRDEGRAEVTGIANVTATLDVSTRVMTYRAEVETIYGRPMNVARPCFGTAV